MNLPFDTYLRDSVVTLYGGVLRGVHSLNVSLGGAFIAYPRAALNSGQRSHFRLHSVTVLDGGRFEYRGRAADADALVIELDGDFTVRGGGFVTANKLLLTGIGCCYR